MRSVPARAAVLSWLEVAGLIGLPDLALELGSMTALIGPRGAGKSQLLSAIAWLLGAADRPPERIDGSARVRARLTDGRSLTVPSDSGDGAATTPLPACTYLR